MIVPELRFPEFKDSGEWGLKMLGELAEIKGRIGYRGYTVEDIVKKGEGAITLSPSNIDDDGSLNFEKSTYISWEKYEESPEIMLQEGFTVLVKTASVGKTALVKKLPEKATINPQFVVLKPIQIDPVFLSFIISHSNIQKQVKDNVGAGAIPNLSQENISKFEVFTPPDKEKKEQQKIADCLSSLDELITAHNQKLEALQSHKKGLMQHLFPAEGETVPKLRFEEFRNKGEWEEYSIDKLVSENILFAPKDGNHGNIHPKSSDYVTEGIPFIMASDLQNGKIDFTKCAYLKKEQADSLQKGFAKEGDVLLSHKGTVGEVVLVKKIKFPYIMLTPQVTYYRVKDKSKLSNEFLATYFISELFQTKLKDAAGGGTRAYLGILEQGKLKMKVPGNILEQQKIAECFSSLDELITAQTEKIEALQKHKKGLMQGLFPK